MNCRASCDHHAQGIGMSLAWRRVTGRLRYTTISVVGAILLAGCVAGERIARDPENGNATVTGDIGNGQHTRQGALPADAPTEDPTGDPSTDSIPRMVVVPFAEAEFVPVRPELSDSPEIAILWGDPATGPSAMLMRLRSGSIPMHMHSSDYHLVVLEGTLKHWDPEESEETAPPLGPGSYWFQPGGLPHAEACLPQTCLLHVVWAGPQDARLAQ
jgi:quercetin dioxygenase-like cupin family protein